MSFLKNIQNFLKESLKEANLKRKVFVEESGIPYTTYDRLIKKTPKHIELSTLLKIADYFHTSLDQIIKKGFKTQDSTISFNTSSLDVIALNARRSIQQQLIEKGLTPYQLGANCDLGENTIPNFLSGKTKALQVSTLIKVADYFEISLDDMIGRVGHTNQRTQLISDPTLAQSPFLKTFDKGDLATIADIRHYISVSKKTLSTTTPKNNKTKNLTPSI
jgi:transcriptional regulator with XRE-family HTH domain